MTSLVGLGSPLSKISSNQSTPVPDASKKRKLEEGAENEERAAKRSKASVESTLGQKKIKQIDPLRDLLKRLNSSKTAEALWNQAQEAVKKMGHPGFTVEFASPEELPNSLGICYHIAPLIKIRSDCSKNEKLVTLVFELHNMLQIENIAKVHADIAAGKMKSKEVYAETLERIEYDSVTSFTKTMLKCAQEGWDPSLLGKIFNPYHWASFEEYLSVQKRIGHTALYMEDFEKVYEHCVKSSKEAISWSRL